MPKMVTLITTAPLSPYNANEVFTVTEAEADALLNPTVVNENGRQVKVESKVVKYDEKNKEHKAALDAQRGKDADVVEDSGVVPSSVEELQEARNKLADAAKEVAAANARAQKAEQDQARVEAELAKLKGDNK